MLARKVRAFRVAAGLLSLLALSAGWLVGCAPSSSSAAVPLPPGGTLAGNVLEVNPTAHLFSVQAANGRTYHVNARNAVIHVDGKLAEVGDLRRGTAVRVTAPALDNNTLELEASRIDGVQPPHDSLPQPAAPTRLQQAPTPRISARIARPEGPRVGALRPRYSHYHPAPVRYIYVVPGPDARWGSGYNWKHSKGRKHGWNGPDEPPGHWKKPHGNHKGDHEGRKHGHGKHDEGDD